MRYYLDGNRFYSYVKLLRVQTTFLATHAHARFRQNFFGFLSRAFQAGFFQIRLADFIVRVCDCLLFLRYRLISSDPNRPRQILRFCYSAISFLLDPEKSLLLLPFCCFRFAIRDFVAIVYFRFAISEGLKL